MDIYSLERETMEQTKDVARRAERNARLHPKPSNGRSHSDAAGSGPGAGLLTPVADRGRTITAAVASALLVVYVVWGSTYLAIRVAIETVPPMLMASVRFLVAGGLLYVFAIRRGDRAGDRPTRRHWLAALVIGGLMLAGGNGGVTWAEQHIPSGLAALLVATVPLWITVFAHLVGMERLTPVVLVGVVIGIAGVAILAGTSAQGANELAGTLVVLGGSIAWAVGSLYSKRASLPSRPLVGIAMEMLAGGVVLLAIAALGGEFGRVHLELVSWRSAVSLAYLMVFGSLFAFTAYIWLLNHAPASVAGTYAFVNPAIAVGLGSLFLGESITPGTVFGGAVILVAVALIVSARSIPLPRLRALHRVQPAVECEAEAA